MIGGAMNHVWVNLLDKIMRDGQTVRPRGQLTLELLSSCIVVDMTMPVVTVRARHMGYRFMAAEAAWILSGDDSVAALEPYSKIVTSFSDDGVTFFGAYGPRLKGQLDSVVAALRNDPDTRQAVANIWRENPPVTRDVPCTLSCQFMIRRGQLDAFVTMRSSDAWLGVVYDVFSFSMWAGYVLLSLKQPLLRLGNLYQTAASRHLYERDLVGATACVNDPTSAFEYLPFNVNDFDGSDSLVSHLWKLAKRQPLAHQWLMELPA